jgi:hypothetical protein
MRDAAGAHSRTWALRKLPTLSVSVVRRDWTHAADLIFLEPRRNK